MVCRSVAVIWLPLLLLFSTQQANAWASSEEKTKPNFLVILVDEKGRVIGMIFASSRLTETGWAAAASEFEEIKDQAGPPIALSC